VAIQGRVGGSPRSGKYVFASWAKSIDVADVLMKCGLWRAFGEAGILYRAAVSGGPQSAGTLAPSSPNPALPYPGASRASACSRSLHWPVRLLLGKPCSDRVEQPLAISAPLAPAFQDIGHVRAQDARSLCVQHALALRCNSESRSTPASRRCSTPSDT
jgi:hypothetical protein